MRTIIIAVFILAVLPVGHSFAENDLYNLKFNPKNNKYALILNELIIKSRLLDLNEKEKGNVSYLESFYLDILDKKTDEYNENQIKIMEIVQTKGSNLKAARRIIRKNAELNLQLGYTFIESLEYIKTNLGVNNFNKLMHSSELELFNISEFSRDKSGSDENEFNTDFESTGIEEEGDFKQ